MANQRILELALKGLQAERERIDQEIAGLRKMMGGRAPSASLAASEGGQKRRKRGKMSAAQKKLISDAMKKRWAKVKAVESKK